MIQNGWWSLARREPSPNCDARPPGAAISLIVIHCISLPPGKFGGDWIDRLFTNRLDPAADPYFQGIASLRVSAHMLIRRDGEPVQYVPFEARAWHAGESQYAGRPRCNDFSIGIELEGAETIPYEDCQYRRLSEVIGVLLRTYPTLSRDAIAGHEHIAPGRKTDPGPAFDWARLRADLLALA